MLIWDSGSAGGGLAYLPWHQPLICLLSSPLCLDSSSAGLEGVNQLKGHSFCQGPGVERRLNENQIIRERNIPGGSSFVGEMGGSQVGALEIHQDGYTRRSRSGKRPHQRN